MTKTLLLSTLLAMTTSLTSQLDFSFSNDCSTPIVVDEIPVGGWCYSWVIPDYEGVEPPMIENPYGQLDPVFGCWNCMKVPVVFRLDIAIFGQLEITFSSTLDNDNNNVDPGDVPMYYAMFDGCYDNGGTILSYPINGNNPMGECWDEFGGDEDFIASSCFDQSCCGWPQSEAPFCYPGGYYETPPYVAEDVMTGEPPWNFPTSDYQITFNMSAGITYYLCVFPPSNCNSETVNFGDMMVCINGPNILGSQEAVEDTEVSEGPTPQPRKIMHQGRLYVLLEGKYYNILGQEVNYDKL